jgi:hypothetical protein
MVPHCLFLLLLLLRIPTRSRYPPHTFHNYAQKGFGECSTEMFHQASRNFLASLSPITSTHQFITGGISQAPVSVSHTSPRPEQNTRRCTHLRRSESKESVVHRSPSSHFCCGGISQAPVSGLHSSPKRQDTRVCAQVWVAGSTLSVVQRF